MNLSNLSPSSKVWLYKADRKLTLPEQAFIEKELEIFIPQWASHGNKLFGAGQVAHDWFIILVVDETHSSASGCSIDTSVQFVKALGKELNIDFFDRMHVLIEQEGKQEQVHFSEISKHSEAKVYNPLISTLEDYRTNWLIKVSESQFA